MATSRRRPDERVTYAIERTGRKVKITTSIIDGDGNLVASAVSRINMADEEGDERPLTWVASELHELIAREVRMFACQLPLW